MIRSLLTTAAIVAATSSAFAEPSGHVRADGSPWAQIETTEHVVTYANVQNLAARWNNVIIFSETGDEQLAMMQESGVFADDFSITFNMPTGDVFAFDDLGGEEIRPLYNQIVENGGQRLNLATNVEIMEFTDDGARARFKYLVLSDGAIAFGGENEILVGERDGVPVILESNIHLLVSNN